MDRMKKILVMPVLVAVLITAACGGDAGPTAVGPTASVRFFNATTGMTGNGGFTTNGQFATGLAFGLSACSAVTAGSTSFGFGAANTGGSGLSGNTLATLNNQSLPAGGTFTVVAAGSALSPTLMMLDNSFSGSLGSSQAAIRFVNLAPGSGATANTFTVLAGAIGSGPTTLTEANIAVGAPTTFNTVSSGSNPFTILSGHEIVISGTAAALNLQSGTVNTIAIVPTSSGGFQLINLPRCS